jgi:hypothetical protein
MSGTTGSFRARIRTTGRKTQGFLRGGGKLWTVAAILFAALLAVIFVPADKAVRTAALPVVSAAFAGILVFALQSNSQHADRRREMIRGAYALLLKAADRVVALRLELFRYPRGRPYPGVISPLNTDDVMRHNPWAEEESISVDMERLALEAEVTLILEEGPAEPGFRAWQNVELSYLKWRNSLHRKRLANEVQGPQPTDEEVEAEGAAIGASIDRLRTVCYDRLRELNLAHLVGAV